MYPTKSDEAEKCINVHEKWKFFTCEEFYNFKVDVFK